MKVNTPPPPPPPPPAPNGGEKKKSAPPPPPPPERVKRDTEVDQQAVNRVSTSKKAWTKPTIRRLSDDMTRFESGPAPDNKEDSFYYPISM